MMLVERFVLYGDEGVLRVLRYVFYGDYLSVFGLIKLVDFLSLCVIDNGAEVDI